MAMCALGAALRCRPAAGLAKHGAAALSRLIQVDHFREFRATASKSSGDQALAVAKSLNPKLFIGGEFVDAASGKTFDSIDPRTEKPIVSLAEGDTADVDRAVDAARKAFDEGAWPRMTAKTRGRVLYKLADLMEAHAEELALLETLDNGKPIFFSRAADIPLAIDHFRYYAGWADKIQGKTIPCDSAHFAYTLHEPLGAVGQIVPWNFSLLMATWKLAPALACGNTVVIKVAEQTPLTALKLAELAAEAGLPPGVLNIITGFGETAGAALARHKKVDKVAFTGSTEVGRLVGKAAAENLKPCTLELGGKSPAIVWKDVDVDKAVEDTHFALFFNHGQCCAAGSRVYVHEDIYDEFVEKSAQRAVGRTVGDPFGDVEQGPQVDAAQFSKIMSYITLGKEQGARMVAGGGRHGSQGFYVEPTVFADVGDDMAIARDEIFGPVMSIMKYSTLDEVLRRANDTPYGLAAGVFSQDIDVVNQLTRGLKSGTVWVNTYNVYDSAVPFGGYKASGVGRDKGAYALEHYTQVKAVYQALRGTPGWL